MSTELLDDDSVERRMKLQKVLESFKTFDATAGWYYREQRRAEAVNIETQIIAIDPVTRQDEIESYKMRGDLRTTNEFLTLLEDTVASLQERIEQMLEREKPSGKNK